MHFQGLATSNSPVCMTSAWRGARHSSAGIGLGIVRRLAAEGAKVMLSSRRQQNVDKVVEQLRAEGLAVAGCVCHVGNPEHIARLVQVPQTLIPRASCRLVTLICGRPAGP